MRQQGQKRGLAIDKAGKLWRGFFAECKSWELRFGITQGSGHCFCCDSLLLEGWESCNEAEGVTRDLCDNCLILPNITIVAPESEDEWTQILREFKNANFDCQRWIKG